MEVGIENRDDFPVRPWAALYLIGFALCAVIPSTRWVSAAEPLRSTEAAAAAESSATPAAAPSTGPLREFFDEIERDFSLRSIGQLQVTNMRGNIVVQGWALDKVRVKARRRVLAASDGDAKRLLAAVEFRYQAGKENIELSAEYGRGLEIQERLQERANPRTSMEMTVFAPANLKLRIWAVDGSVNLKSWSSDVEVRTASGPIQAESIKAESISLLCPSCTIHVRSVRGSLRCMGGTGAIQIQSIDGPQVYVESSSGSIKAGEIRGEQLYVSKSGAVFGQGLKGRIEFHTQDAPVEISESSGFLSGRTETGPITARMREWQFMDRALIESAAGNIVLALPGRFSGDVDIWSKHGSARMDFPLFRQGVTAVPEPARRIVGRIGDGGGQLRVYSEKGNIQFQRAGSS